MNYGLIGEHLTHSYSCEIHAKIADYAYELCELAPAAVGRFMEEKKFCAINVTIPYKQTVMPYLDEISDMALSVGAVNTVVNRDGRLYGYNTDFVGMEALLRHTGLTLRDKKVLILGTGGTSATAAAVAKHQGAKEIYAVSRHPETCGARATPITYEQAYTEHSDAQMVINTTPVGMYHAKTQGSPIDLAAFPAVEGVVDAIYHPLRTPLILDAIARGIPACGGLYMLVTQAVYASAHFLGREPKEALIDSVYAAMCREKQNVVLIGMPSAGKTTVGRALAERLGQPFVDTDVCITRRIGMPISAYIPHMGEPAFREVERQVIAEASEESGRVIATGGGAILSEENVRALRQNGVLVFLDRAPENLITTADRPLSSDRAKLTALYRTRYDKYCAAADLHLDANRTVNEEIEDILRHIKEGILL